MTPEIPTKLSDYLADVCSCYAADRRPERIKHGSLILTVCATCNKPIRPRG